MVFKHNLFSTTMILGNQLNNKSLVLSFDDGPNNDTTPLLLDALKKHNVKAIFFLVGANMDNGALLNRMINEGHILGSHSFSHAHLTTITKEELANEVAKVEDLFVKHIGDRPFFFRPPFGETNVTVNNYLQQQGYINIGWNIDTLDWKQHTPFQVFDHATNILSRRRRGGIVLMHEYKWTTEAQSIFLPAAKDMGFEFVDPLTMLGKHQLERLQAETCEYHECSRTRPWCPCSYMSYYALVLSMLICYVVYRNKPKRRKVKNV